MNKEVHKVKNQKYWSIVFIVVVLGLVGAGFYSFWKTTNQEIASNINLINTATISQASNSIVEDVILEKYENSDYDFSIEYPQGWQREISKTGQGSNEIFSLNLSQENQSVSISVMSDEMEGLVRNSISISNESTLDINGLTATKLEGGSAKDGSLVNLVIIKSKGRLYSFRGIGLNFDKIVSSFKLLQTIHTLGDKFGFEPKKAVLLDFSENGSFWLCLGIFGLLALVGWPTI